MKKTKEEKIIDDSLEKLKELKVLFKDGMGVKAYEVLLSNYVELVKKYDTTLKINDNIGRKLITNNFSLQENLIYSIDSARSKLFYNISEHKKTKRTLFFYENRAKILEEEIIKMKNSSFLERLENIESYLKQDILNIEKINVNPINIEIADILHQYSKDDKLKNLNVVKIDIQDFEFLISNMKEEKKLKNFLSLIYKFFKNSFHKDDLVLHLSNERFCIFSTDFTTEKLHEKLKILNTKRVILGLTISFFINVIKYKNNESISSFEKRCELL